MATEHDQLAKRMLKSDELSRTHSAIELQPLEQLIARVQVRWPFPEMGQLEYADWMESLKLCPLEKIQAALNRLMDEPPKIERSDGVLQEYRGRPSLVDVLRTMEILDDERAAEFRKKQAEADRQKWREMERRRAEHPEEFFGLADVLKAANVTKADQIAQPMPQVRTIWPDIDPDRNKATLDKQKQELNK